MNRRVTIKTILTGVAGLALALTAKGQDKPEAQEQQQTPQKVDQGFHVIYCDPDKLQGELESANKSGYTIDVNNNLWVVGDKIVVITAREYAEADDAHGVKK